MRNKRGVLSEMRTLPVELRPSALIDTALGDLIGHQVNALLQVASRTEAVAVALQNKLVE